MLEIVRALPVPVDLAVHLEVYRTEWVAVVLPVLVVALAVGMVVIAPAGLPVVVLPVAAVLVALVAVQPFWSLLLRRYIQTTMQ